MRGNETSPEQRQTTYPAHLGLRYRTPVWSHSTQTWRASMELGEHQCIKAWSRPSCLPNFRVLWCLHVRIHDNETTFRQICDQHVLPLLLIYLHIRIILWHAYGGLSIGKIAIKQCEVYNILSYDISSSRRLELLKTWKLYHLRLPYSPTEKSGAKSGIDFDNMWKYPKNKKATALTEHNPGMRWRKAACSSRCPSLFVLPWSARNTTA